MRIRAYRRLLPRTPKARQAPPKRERIRPRLWSCSCERLPNPPSGDAFKADWNEVGGSSTTLVQLFTEPPDWLFDAGQDFPSTKGGRARACPGSSSKE